MRIKALALLGTLFFAAVPVLTSDEPRIGPPPLRIESPTLQPSPRHVWIPGYWKWAGINYAWIDGRWVKAKPKRAWVPGTWEQVGNHWVWKPGSWKKIETGEPKAVKKKKK